MIVAWATALVSAGCEPPVEPILNQERRVLVHAILDMAADTQRVMLEWTGASIGTPAGITNATVTMTAPDGRTVALTMRPNAPLSPSGPARYIFLLSESWQALQRGRTYRLDITVPGEPAISGTTTIPDTLATTTVNVRTLPFARLRDTLRMRWPAVKGASGYRVMSSATDPLSPGFFLTTHGIFTDNDVVLPGTKETLGGGDFFPAGFLVHITALAVDENYFTYYKTAADPFAGAPLPRLTGGAVGVFGAIVPIVRHRFQVL